MDGDVLAISAPTKPIWLTITDNNDGTATLTGTPGDNDVGIYQITLQVDDGNSTITQEFTLTVNAVADTPSVTNTHTEEHRQSTEGLVISRNAVDGPEVTHFKITNIKEGTLYQNDGTTEILADTFITVEAGQAGLKFTPAGIKNGTFDIQASLSDNNNGLGGDVITATINLGLTNEPPVLSKIGDILMPFGNGMVTFTAEASDPDVPAQNLQFSLSGDVPDGATINAIGQFYWVPREAGQFTFTVVVTDNGNNPSYLSASEEITITLTKNPIMAPIGNQTVPINIPLTFTAKAVHHHPLTFSLKNAPADATIDPETGIFNWTPIEKGVYTATIVVTEPAGLTAIEGVWQNPPLSTHERKFKGFGYSIDGDGPQF